MNTADAIANSFQSPNVADSNMEAANVVDVIHDLSRQARNIALAITPNAAPGQDANGGTVASLTEAVMGITGGLDKIATAIADLASAIREHGEQ